MRLTLAVICAMLLLPIAGRANTIGIRLQLIVPQHVHIEDNSAEDNQEETFEYSSGTTVIVEEVVRGNERVVVKSVVLK